VYGNSNGPNGNGDEPFSAPSRSFHFTCSDPTTAFVRSGGSGPKETETGESVSAPSHSLQHHTLRFHYHLLPWRSLVTAGGSMDGHSFSFQSSVKGDSYYPELSPQRAAEAGGFGLYFVSLHT